MGTRHREQEPTSTSRKTRAASPGTTTWETGPDHRSEHSIERRLGGSMTVNSIQPLTFHWGGFNGIYTFTEPARQASSERARPQCGNSARLQAAHRRRVEAARPALTTSWRRRRCGRLPFSTLFHACQHLSLGPGRAVRHRNVDGANRRLSRSSSPRLHRREGSARRSAESA